MFLGDIIVPIIALFIWNVICVLVSVFCFDTSIYSFFCLLNIAHMVYKLCLIIFFLSGWKFELMKL